MELDLNLGAYRLSKRTIYSKFQITDANNNNLTDTPIGQKILKEYNDQLENPEKYFVIEGDELIHCPVNPDIDILFIPDDIKIIRGASLENGKFKYVNIPKSLSFVGSHAFKSCFNLKEVYFSDNFNGELDWSTFSTCISLEKITLPTSLLTIPKFCFDGCLSLNTINMPPNLIQIGTQAFHACSTLTDLTLPDTVEYIGDFAFANCNNLSKINIPKNLYSFGSHAFEYSGVKELIFNHNLEKREEGAYGNFLRNSKIHKITISNTVDFIDPAFISSRNCVIDEVNFLGNKEEFKKFSRKNRSLLNLLYPAKINILNDNLEGKLENNTKNNYIEKIKNIFTER